jgi:hypothetical protein
VKKRKIILELIVLSLISAPGLIIAQQEMDGVKVTDAGTFSGNLNGKNFNNPIRYSEAEDLVTITTGDEGFTLTINCEGISSISQLKTGAYKLPSSEEVTVTILDHNNPMPSMVTSGNFTISENDEKVIKGSLEFTASAGGIPKEMGGTETSLTDGKFEITKKNK